MCVCVFIVILGVCSNKPGNLVYNSWCSQWERESGERMTPGAKMFLVDQYLPVWVQCTLPDCGKWRKLPPAIELHHVKQDIVKCSDCARPEDEVGVVFLLPRRCIFVGTKVVAMVRSEEWINTVSYTPLLRYSLLAPLLSEYFPDGVGLSPATVRHSGTPRKRGGKAGRKDTTHPAERIGGVTSGEVGGAAGEVGGAAGEVGGAAGGGEVKREQSVDEGGGEHREGATSATGANGASGEGVSGEGVSGEVKRKENTASPKTDKNGNTHFLSVLILY